MATFQPLTAEPPTLTVTVATKPAFHEFCTVYLAVHPPLAPPDAVPEEGAGGRVTGVEVAGVPGRAGTVTEISGDDVEGLAGRSVVGRGAGEAAGDGVTGWRVSEAAGDGVTGWRVSEAAGDGVTGWRVSEGAGDGVPGSCSP
jgi:hypothetical protein